MVPKVSFLSTVLVLGFLVADFPRLRAQGSFAVDQARAAKGRALFTEKGCQGCHSIGRGKMAGPDLLNVTQRAPVAWLRRFLKDPRALYDAGDPRTVAMVEQHQGFVMPNFRLKDDEIETLIHFLASGMRR
ncbi:MAG TPA: cytochrome c [Gemmatimonadales bacterium]|jgi:mono/diheme cytochrome c family protein|nr:cytochrome c [Gemmatimonadales bacterium]